MSLHMSKHTNANTQQSGDSILAENMGSGPRRRTLLQPVRGIFFFLLFFNSPSEPVRLHQQVEPPSLDGSFYVC